MTTAIRVENLSKAYRLYDKPSDRVKEALNIFSRKSYHRDFFALKDVSFEIEQGETVGIIGKNGSGKSTLLKIVTGVLTPTGGNVMIHGKVSALLELGIGFNPELSGIENVYFSGTIMGYTKEEMDAKVDDILSFADIGEFINQPTKTYSSGMFVRLAFAVAINVDPEVFIVDEALSVGDIRFQQKCLRKINDFRDKGKTVLFVSHDMGSIKRFCNRAIWLKDGLVYKTGEPKVITQEFHNYMIFDELPGEKVEKNELTKVESDNKLEKDSQQIDWEDATGLDSTGNGEAEIKRVAFLSQDRRIVEINGNEDMVSFVADITIHEDILQPLIGLIIYNHLGLPAVHISNATLGNDIEMIAKGRVFIKFDFKMPPLANGNYTCAIGINDGTQNDHVVLDRIHEAYVFKVDREDLRARIQYGYIYTKGAELTVENV